jgi:hypothetical protein
MKSIIRKSLVPVAFILVITIVMSVTTLGDDPVIQNIDYTPKNPEALSTIVFTATVIGDSPTVYVFVEECRDDLCYADVQNVTMDKIDTTQFEKAITLRHGEANIIHYQIIVESNGMWYNSSLMEFSLNGQETDGNGTPGFEGVILIAAVVGLITILKKRY